MAGRQVSTKDARGPDVPEQNPLSKRTVVVFSERNKYIIDVKTRPTGDYALLEGPATAMMKKLADELLGS